MKSILNKKWYGVPILVFALVAVLGVGAIVYAAQTLTAHGTVTVVQSGGGGTPPAQTFLYRVYDAASGGTEITNGDSAFFALPNINVNSSYEKTVYFEKAGTGDLTVTPSVTGLDPATGTITFTPTSASVTAAGRSSIVVKFTAGPSPAAADAFDITFTGNP